MDFFKVIMRNYFKPKNLQSVQLPTKYKSRIIFSDMHVLEFYSYLKKFLWIRRNQKVNKYKLQKLTRAQWLKYNLRLGIPVVMLVHVKCSMDSMFWNTFWWESLFFCQQEKWKPNKTHQKVQVQIWRKIKIRHDLRGITRNNALELTVYNSAFKWNRF
jgi:hypothetical protein